MIRVSFQFDPKILKLDIKPAQSVIAALNSDLNLDGSIGVRIIDEQVMRQLNKQYSHEDKATDVLSFPYEEGEELGDIVVSRSHVTTQADQAGTDEATEFALLVLHGVLHILGYDHQDKAERAVMDRLQSQYLEIAGLSYRNFDWKDVVR